MLFTYRDYLGMLQQLQDRGYRFAAFPETEALLARGARFVLMRHDVDLDLEKAVALAEREADFGISATYFFLLRTEHYNVFSRLGSQAVARILDLGHHLGLHFDCAAYEPGLGLDALAAACAREVRVLADWFGTMVSIVSIHRPNEIARSGDARLTAPLPHTYMPLYTHQTHYLSDSRGAWRFGEPADSVAFQEGRPLHILTHPIWWHEEPIPAHDVLADLVARRTDALEASVARNCTVFRSG
jgi:hypothetical protein